MTIRVHVDAFDREALENFVAAEGWVYQGPRFADVLRVGLGQRVVHFTAERDGQLCGALALAILRSPFFGNFAESLPVADHSGPVVRDEETAAALLSAVADFVGRERLDHAQLRQLEVAPGTQMLPASQEKVTMQLALPDDASVLWDSLKAKVRNLCRKGEKASLGYRSGGAELLDAFYAVYARNLRDLGTPCYPRSLFEAWLESFPDATRIHTAHHPDGRVCAVGMTFRHRDRQQIPFAASRREDRALAPNMFLYWKMLEWSVETGCRSFDFGRSTRESGTWRFKKQWGATEVPLTWSYVLPQGADLPQLSKEDGRFSLATKVWTKLPVPVATALSSRLARILP